MGVLILTLVDGLVAGVIPALGTATAVIRSAAQGESQVSLAGLCISVLLPIAIITAAIGAFRGSDLSRLALLFLLVIYFTLQAFQNASLIIGGLLSPQAETLSYGRSLAAIALVLANIWYFLRPATIAFYRRPVNPNF
jgi:hypothetical protein